MKRTKTIRVRSRRLKTRKPKVMRKVAKKVKTRKTYTKRRPRMKDVYHKEK